MFIVTEYAALTVNDIVCVLRAIPEKQYLEGEGVEKANNIFSMSGS